jgi:hypothetical protein
MTASGCPHGRNNLAAIKGQPMHDAGWNGKTMRYPH